jgi:inositol-hexakisphosphate kinase
VREVGSATISLRQGAVELLESDSDEDKDGSSEVIDPNGEDAVRHSPRKPHGRKTFKDLLNSHRPRSGSRVSQSHPHPHSPSKHEHSQLQLQSPEKTQTQTRNNHVSSHRTPIPSNQTIRFSLNRTSTLPSSQPTKSSSSNFKTRRARANSLHFPSDSPSSTEMKNKIRKDFYLSHYSTDRAYSLEPTKKQINIDLGLGDDFDKNFGEAMRKGLGGEEMQLPPQALRVLSEAKENMDLRLVGKQGRKGSLGMGLFKESREGEKKRVKAKDKDTPLEEVEEAIISDSDPLSPTLLRGFTPEIRPKQEIVLPPALPVPITTTTTRQEPSTIEDLSQSTAGLEISSPTRVAAESPHKSDIFSEESGWTTTDSDDDGSSSNSSRSKGSEGMESSDEDEGESMTVPLQPFNHAVGGHSSIYKFTRRAVCKVSPLTRI